MAVITSSQTGLWSAGATWIGGIVPGDGDAAIVDVPHRVTFDVDQSAFPNGVAGLTINGILDTDDSADHYLKMDGDVIGSGNWYIGSDVADFPSNRTMTIDLGGAANSIASGTLTLHFYCAEPTYQYVRITALEPAGRDTLTVDTDVTADLWDEGDTVWICNVNYGRDVEERIIAGGGILPSEIRFTVALAADKAAGSYLILQQRNIRIINSTDYAFKSVVDSNIGVEISGCTNGFNGCDGNIIYGTLCGATNGFTSCLKNTLSGILASITRGLYSACYSNIITGDIIGCDHAAYTASGGGNNTWLGDIIGCGNGLFFGWHDAVLGSIIKCGTGVRENTSLILLNVTLDNTTDLNAVVNLSAYNTLFDGATEFANYNSERRPPWDYGFSIDHDQVTGAFKAWTLGGIVTNDTVVRPPGEVQSYKHACEDADNPVFMQQKILIQPGDIFEYTVYARKDAAMAYLPRAQLIDPAEDPLKDDSFTPLAEDIMTNSVNTWETLTLTYTNTTAYPKEVIVRTLAQNATDNAWFLVEGGRVVPPVSPNPPTFDALTNDGDGDAVTLTITPPAAGNYDRTLIYYKRAGIYEAWSSGGTYVGVQGVAGTVQVTGLDDNQFYQFILVAEYSGLYSLPSALRRVLVIATTTPATMPDFVTELAEHCAARFNNLIYETNVFANHQPDSDSTNPVVFFLGTGGPPGRFDDAWREITVQVLVTSPAVSGYTAGWNMIKNIEAEYHSSHAWNLPSFYISTGERVQPPYPLGRDKKGREQFSFNLHFKMRRL